jgi:hypothetical protein
MKKYAVITFLFNHYDLLREPLVIDENAEYYCLTDDKELVSDNWKCIYIDKFNTDELTGIQKTYMCKYSFYKYIPSEYEYYITIDASIEVANKLTPIIEYTENNGFDIGLSMHPTRTKWSDEYSEWEKSRGLKHHYVEVFYKYANELGFNIESDNGLIECTIKVYKNNKAIKEFIDDVYKTLRDAMNFNDSNEQCYFTCVYSKHMDKIKTFFFTRQLYSNSVYFNSYYHKTNNKWINDVNIENNTNVLFGKKVKLVEFIAKKDNLDIFIGTQKTFTPVVKNDAYKIIVGNHEIENNSNLELIKCKNDLELDDRFYSELYMLYYVSKNIELPEYVGFCHNRRYFSFLDDIPDLDKIFSEYDAVCSKPKVFNNNIKSQYGTYHNIEDLYIVGGIIADRFPHLSKLWHNFINGSIFIPYNMFIMKREDFKEYIDFIFSILDEYLKIVGTDINKRIYNNIEKYVKDFYPNNTVEYQYRIGGYIAERLTNLFMMHKFKKIKTYPVIVTEDKYNQKK